MTRQNEHEGRRRRGGRGHGGEASRPEMAAEQVGAAGNAEQREGAIAIVNDARRALHEHPAKG